MVFFWEREALEARTEYRHPGHEDQSSHGKWAHGKNGPAPGQGVAMSRADIMAARFGHLPTRIQERVVPENAIGMRSPDGKFTVLDRTGQTSPETVKATYDMMEGLAGTYGARATAVNIHSDDTFNRDFNMLGNASATMAATTVKTGVVDVKASYLESMGPSSPGLVGAAHGVPQGPNLLTHEYGHIATASNPAVYSSTFKSMQAPSVYGASSSSEKAAEFFTAYQYGDRSSGTVAAADYLGFSSSDRSLSGAEYRHPGHEDQGVHGNWAKGRLDAQEFGDLPLAAQTAFLAACEKRGIDLDGMENDLDRVLAENPDLLTEAESWYPDANKVAQEMSEMSGMSLEQSAGVMSALSPQKEWGTGDKDTSALGNKDLALLMAKYPNAFASVTDSDSALEAMRVLAKQTTGRSSAVLGPNVWNAVRIMRGESIDMVFNPNGALKTRSFVNNILHPGLTSSVTVDAHMSKLLMTGGGLGTAKATTAAMTAKINQAKTTGIDVKSIGYIAVSKTVQDYAATHGLSPDHVQAAYWLYARRNISW